MTTPDEVRTTLAGMGVTWQWATGTLKGVSRQIGTLPANVGVIELLGEPDVIKATYLGALAPDLLTAAALNGRGMALLLAILIPGWQTSERWLVSGLQRAGRSKSTRHEVQIRVAGWQVRLVVEKKLSRCILTMERV